jgi:hypothetical protein
MVWAWNLKWRPGQLVRYWTGPKDKTPCRGLARIRGRAFIDQRVGHVRLLGRPGLVPLTRIEAID